MDSSSIQFPGRTPHREHPPQITPPHPPTHTKTDTQTRSIFVYAGPHYPRRACAAMVTVVCLSVCLFVYNYSRTTGYEAAYERYQHLQCYKGTKNKTGNFAETTAFERYGVKTSEKANMHNEHWLTSTAFSPFGAPWTN